ncbi:Anti-sigma regulatory factor (Ser/Thr protein kinase) [Amycolatopsis pretoriensis]|uniref:Anti-sigma regulatory factor (Ser/Thr protein kinase) n=1 Tax=Amycolatopsis pretoriensis TaxID=218821 RepID=A0A1H5QX71_9PSEU|nr:ATP-binding protein [Amycolatopsis pretoriensis]SEF30746.1 Anti-sigma regulatory factor (Ser/Thr protein kinase) [Amycolatopsis pretoriensis]
MTMSKMPPRTAVQAAPLTVSLPDDVTAPARARHEVRSTLLAAGLCEAQLDDVLLATSELVTNAFEHGERPRRLELAYADGRLTLRVHDAGPLLPELRAPSPAEARSRGLVLVQALSEDWGFERCPGGKFVWAVFRITGG